MIIDKNTIDNEIIIKIEGRLDTNSSPDLEKELDNLNGTESVTLDFEKLEYISSAGLRIVLILQKKMQTQGSLIIKNMNETVKNIFDITGFSDILNIQ